MAGTRRFSQISDDPTSPESSIGVFTNSRSSLGRSMNGNGRETKRRKTAGLNSRFDRMVEAMNATHHSPIKSGRRRTHTASSSSASEPPNMDAYNGLEKGCLGKGFSLIKMKPPAASSSSVTMSNVEEAGASNKISQSPQASKALPEWLCSTFSSLDAKHPLRLLLPKEPFSPQDTSIAVPFAPVDHSNSSIEAEPDSIFAFSPHQRSDAMLDDHPTNQIDVNEDAHHLLLSTGVPRSPPVDQEDTLPYQSRPPNCDHLSSALVMKPFSTSHSTSVLSSVPVHRSTFGGDQVGAQGLNILPGLDDLDFVPFSTPGPGSTLSLASDTAPQGPSPNFELYPQDCFTDMNDSALSLRISPFSTLGPTASHTTQPASSDGPSFCLPVDSCLPPYNAAPSDPAPAYSSDDIPEYSYYEDHCLTDDTGSEPPLDQLLFDASHLPNVFATPGPGYCAPRPIYFDSPIEDPSDSDPLQPGYEIDYGTIDFQWEPFNRKGIDDERRMPGTGPHHEIYDTPSLRQAVQEPELQYADDARSNFALAPEHLPSPSPFRFSSYSDPSKHVFLSPLTHELALQAEHQHTPEPQQPAPVFAPAPGIFISPLRGKSNSPPVTQTTLDETSVGLQRLTQNKRPSNSQGSDDSIESWRDVE
ncbi:hypothetical protein D9615_002523 [Tricholomella constricta]|uniref:Uncharacterized protein n=1 Tax=Tricholomella constricta TaxID=117010 RepID=A0A8H5M9S4_9AGAR|nr:hypothetical protein D9615_002523 [Tricholomella constricta]